MTVNLTGCKVLFINTSLRKNEHLPMLRDLLPSLTSSPLLAMSDAACPELRSVIIVDNDNAGAAAFETLLEREGFGGRDFRRVMQWDDRHNVQGVPGREQLDRNDVCNIQLTSGTTGASKGCSLTHRNLLNNGIYVGERMHLKFPRMDPASGKLVGETLANVPPLYHCFGLVLGNLAVATHAGCVVYPACVSRLDSTCTDVASANPSTQRSRFAPSSKNAAPPSTASRPCSSPSSGSSRSTRRGNTFPVSQTWPRWTFRDLGRALRPAHLSLMS